MSRNALILHGTGARPEWLWYSWLGSRLRERGYDVVVPHHPGINVDPLADVLPQVLAHRFDEETVLVGHSGGAALLLAVLERLEVAVAQSVLVAGYSTPPNDGTEPALQTTYDWPAIRRSAGDLWFVNSVTDPYGCDAEQGRAMQRRLRGTLVVRDDPAPGAGTQLDPRHFEADTLELVDRLIP
ncbi:alpha/beta hydrolase [Myceligenerans crystallogenes]|uniref:AB hydrolase-1 domain-containing protein n=1 Tax=Myceligenerans crystallogenes TaxID=316335 RepID=A0ABN2N8E8_9MICO